MIVSDRALPGAYEAVQSREWDAVFEVSWQPQFVRAALDALADRAGHWTYVSSGNVYADTTVRGAREDEVSLLAPTTRDRVDREHYGEAKVACEQAAVAAVGDRLLIARSGLIGGPGDPFDRVGYWVARAARDQAAPMLVPAPDGCPTQVVDVRDLAAWLVSSAVERRVATVNAVGPPMSFADWVELSRTVGGATGEVVAAPTQWLVERDVGWFMGPESIAMWLPGPEHFGFSDRDGARAEAAGLTHRPRTELLADVLTDERARGLDRPRAAGLSAEYERELISQLVA